MSTDDVALLTVEQRVRSLISVRLATITKIYGAYLATLIVENPDASMVELLSRPDVHSSLTRALDAAAAAVDPAIRAGYRAAAAAAVASAAAQLEELGIEIPSKPPIGDYLDAVMVNVRSAFTLALLDIGESVGTAHASVRAGLTGTTAAQILAVTAAQQRAIRRLGVRINAAAAVAVHRGYSDGQLSLYQAVRHSHPHLSVQKTWVTTSADPCPVCRALDGTIVAVDAEFDYDATLTPQRTPPRVYRNLQGPPRHPNCRCRLVVEPTTASRRIRDQIAKPLPKATPTYLTAAQVRAMSSAQYATLTRFLAAAARRLRTLLGKIRAGD